MQLERANAVTSASQRRVINFSTGFLDCSVLYGSTQATNNYLRAWEKGLMRSFIHPKSKEELLPLADNATTRSMMETHFSGTVFLAGDKRANVTPMLQTLHTLFLREHNRKAKEIFKEHPSAFDEVIYQRARSWVIALFQKITINQYMPVLTGESLEPYTGYNQNIDPSIDTDFIGGAYRYGHSAISGNILRVDKSGEPLDIGHIHLQKHFFRTDALLKQTNGDIESILRGLVVKRDQEADCTMVDEMRYS